MTDFFSDVVGWRKLNVDNLLPARLFFGLLFLRLAFALDFRFGFFLFRMTSGSGSVLLVEFTVFTSQMHTHRDNRDGSKQTEERPIAVGITATYRRHQRCPTR
jgi:hypothetical protein